ncbi:M20 family metallopeptidase [Candidatus Dependentiae bacterium]|nr:M20 family metallopeptidase [Candidatus Dependentiae bacterium]
MTEITQIKESAEKHFEKTLNLLEVLVNTNSGSYNIKGNNIVLNLISDKLTGLGFRSDIKSGSDNRSYLLASNVPDDEDAYLILGHLDTVFSPDSGFDKFTRVNSSTITGPGVIDMKGGIVVFYLAMKILHDLKFLSKIPIRIIFNTDEEIGSYSVRELFKSIQAQVLGVFNFEGARESGALVTARKGVGDFKVVVHGKSAHAGSHFTEGSNAIIALSDKVLKISKITNLEKGITVTPGIIKGGTRTNVIPDYAEVDIDIRVCDNRDIASIEEQLTDIIKEEFVPGTSCELIGSFSRPSLKKTEKIEKTFQYFKKSASELYNIELTAESTGGGSDSNFFGDLDILMIDGLGPVGGNDHTTDEYIELETIKQRAAIFSLTLISIDNDRSQE